MDFKHSIFKRKAKKDYRQGLWYVRLRWKDDGKWRIAERKYENRNAALDGLAAFQEEIRRSMGDRTQGGAIKTFNQLVEKCKKDFYHAPTFEAGMKTGGVKSLSTVNAGLAVLTEYFNNRLLAGIDEGDLRRYREWRKDQGSRNPSLVKKGIKAEVKPSTINRELTTCRRMFSYALEKGIITRDIFRNAKAIHKKLEEPRTRTLTHAEIDRLLIACSDSRTETFKRRRRDTCKEGAGDFDELKQEVSATNLFMKPAILLAADSGLRKGEILSLRWSDIDISARRVSIRREVAKTEKARIEGLTKRTIEALIEILPFKIADDSFVFVSALNQNKPMANITRPWNKVKKLAGLSDIRFHDLRRTTATVAVRDLGYSPEYAAKILGHAPGSAITLKHYVMSDDTTIDMFVDRLDELHRQHAAIEVGNVEN